MVINKRIRHWVTDFVFPALQLTHVDWLTEPFYSGIGSILMFHRVCPQENTIRIRGNAGLEVTPDYLDNLVQYLKNENYEFVSLDHVYNYLSGSSQPKKFIAVTFDDGYADNYTYAWPILKKWNVPFTIYVTTHFPDGEAILWWYLLEDVVLKQDQINWNYGDSIFHLDCKTTWQKEEAFHQLRQFFSSLEEKKLNSGLISFFGEQKVDLHEKTRELALNWDQIKEMSRDPLIEFGPHTVSHPTLSQLSETDAKDEMIQSKKIIESHTGMEAKHFSYPFGTNREAGIREFKLAGSCGFKTSTTTRYGNIFPQHSNQVHSLPRIPVNPIRDGNDPRTMNLWIRGALPCLINKFRRLPLK